MATAHLSVMPRVEAGFGVPTRQNRWTVAFRLVLLVPQLVVTWFLGVVATVLVVLGWCAALVTGRLPPAFLPFVTAFIQYQVRVYAYAALLTDVYPPFSLEAPYPVTVDAPATPVRRLAVLFRVVLCVPANLVLTLATSGIGIASVVIWLIVLVNGSMPPALFGAVAAVARFSARASAYACMVTATYPGELFGDATYTIRSGAPAVPVGPAYGAAPPPHYGAPPPPRHDAGSAPTQPAPVLPGGYAPPAVGAPAPGPRDPGASPPAYFGPPPATGAYVDPAGAPPAYPPTPTVAPHPPSPAAAPPPGAVAAAPRTGPLVLTQASKGILVLFLVLGGIGWVTYVVAVAAVVGNGVTGQDAARAVLAAHEQLSATLATVEQRQAGCGATLSCVQSGDADLASAFAAYQARQAQIAFPSGSQSAASQVAQASATLVALLRQLSSDSPGAYANDASRLQTAADNFDSSFQALEGTLPAP